jgi:hypothetical protein
MPSEHVGVEHDIVASHPESVPDPSDSKTKVRHPLVETTVPGEVPENGLPVT